MIILLIAGIAVWALGRAIEKAARSASVTNVTYTDNRQYHYHQTEVHNYDSAPTTAEYTKPIRF